MLFESREKSEKGLASGLAGGQRGQALTEFIVVFPILVVLFLFVAAQAWWWWNQASAAVAIHDGTAAAAHHTGSLAEGYGETRRALAAPLGGTAQDYEGTYAIVELPHMRATAGRIANARVIDLPYVGPALFTVEARSFQRKEQFYGGPPAYFE
jgi:hypothetical protein